MNSLNYIPYLSEGLEPVYSFYWLLKDQLRQLPSQLVLQLLSQVSSAYWWWQISLDNQH